METQTILLIWNAANTLTLTAIAVSNYFTSRAKAAHDTVKAVDEKAVGLHARVVVLEEAMRHIPDGDELAVLHGRITEVSEGQKTLQGTVQQMNQTLHLIHTQLLTGGRDK